MQIEEITYSSFNNEIKPDFYVLIFFDDTLFSQEFLEIMKNIVSLLRNEDFTLFICNANLVENFFLMETFKTEVSPSLHFVKRETLLFSDERCDEDEEYYKNKILSFLM